MNSLTQLLSQVEKKWLALLLSQCKRQFEGIHLPSHDHTHHFRVWHYARLLAFEHAQSGRTFSFEGLEQLIVAVFFHDQGMSRSILPEHGNMSRDLCAAFLQSHPLVSKEGCKQVLDAVLYHDNKDYATGKEDSRTLLSLLNLADDLDAFGNIGIYRYAEIMLLRGTPPGELPQRILSNADNRCRHLVSLLPGSDSPFANNCLQRYESMRDFFLRASEQEKNIEYKLSHMETLQILRQIQDIVIDRKMHPLCLATSTDTMDDSMRSWWQRFNLEWNLFQYEPYETPMFRQTQ
jgi:hypothetical protein